MKHFDVQWDEVPIVVIDTETTGLRLGVDRAVSVAFVRFDLGRVSSFSTFVNPGFPIPPEATAIHKITDDLVRDAPTIDDVFLDPRVIELLWEAHPAAYNAPFDREMVPRFCDWQVPWLDPLVLARHVDRFAPGKGRHKLENVCKRHGIELLEAHSAKADARAAGEVLFKLGRETFPPDYSLGRALCWLKRVEAVQWFRFEEYRSRLP